MTISEVITAYAGYWEKEARHVEVQEKIIWESTRWQTWHLLNASGKIFRRPIASPDKLIKFSWDKQPEKLTDEEIIQADKKFPDKINGNS